MLKITGSLDLSPKVFKANDVEVVGIKDRADEMVKKLSKSKRSKNDKSKILTHISDIRVTAKPIFLTLIVKKVFNHLR